MGPIRYHLATLVPAPANSCNNRFHGEALKNDLPHLENLASQPRFSQVFLEITSKCNLRCVYCLCGDPEYVGADMSPEILSKSVATIKGLGIRNIFLNVLGELTHAEGWERITTQLLENGFNLWVHTNSAYPFSWEQARIMSRFTQIFFSVDTPDQQLLRQIRRKMDIRTVIHNIALVRATAAYDRVSPPRLVLNAVLNDLTVGTLGKLVALAVSERCGVHVLPMDELYCADSDIQPKSIMSLSGPDLEKACTHIVEAMALAKEQEVPFRLSGNLLEFVVTAMNSGFQSEVTESKPVTSKGGEAVDRHYIPLAERETRDCVDPWSMLLFRANGRINPCCNSGLQVADVAEAHTLGDIGNSGTLRELRTQLLTGDLSETCRTCTVKSKIRVAEFQRKVADWLSGEKETDDTDFNVPETVSGIESGAVGN